MHRLITLENLPPEVTVPAYDPAHIGTGIVHIGVGAFHRAHQAVYTDDALAEGEDWRIVGASLRSTDIVDALNGQNGLYTVLERGKEGTRARVIASIARVVAASREPDTLLAALADPATRIVSLTVTEKAYGVDRAGGTIQEDHPSIKADLENPRRPQGAIGFIVEGLRLRREAGTGPYTVLCCDNLPENGKLVRAGVLDFASRVDTGLAGWIEAHVEFPSTMVDRITPASTGETLADAEKLIGARDLAAIETEPFSQWVIEDRFSGGRPKWEAGGAIFTDDVAPYERMKLRMLNGSHSMLAYAGHLAGLTYVRDVMKDEPLAALVRRHLGAASRTLEPLDGIDFDKYAEALANRFANPAIAHQTYQIAMDGTEKLPQRLLEPALASLHAGDDLRPFAFAVAAWMRYCTGRTDGGEAYDLRDPREEELKTVAEKAGGGASALAEGLHGLPRLFPEELTANDDWTGTVTHILGTMLGKGMRAAIDEEAAGL